MNEASPLLILTSFNAAHPFVVRRIYRAELWPTLRNTTAQRGIAQIGISAALSGEIEGEGTEKSPPILIRSQADSFHAGTHWFAFSSAFVY